MGKVLALSKKTREYVLKDYRDKENPPKFIIKSMSKRHFYKLLSESNIRVPKGITAKGEADIENMNIWEMMHKNYEANLKILENGYLTGWSDVMDEAGDPLSFAKENIEYLHEDIITELVKEIVGEITPAESKNS